MIKIYENYSTEEILNRKIDSYEKEELAVKRILADVAARGDGALIEYGKKFDGADIQNLEVSEQEFEEAERALPPEYKQIILNAKANIQLFHERQLKKGFSIQKQDGIILGQKYTPIERAGVYVPGGTASYPSTVLMDIIPAKIAGVKQVVMVTPVKADGKVKAEILFAAKAAGVDKVFKTGGAQSIAALAFGTQTIPKVDKIVGPGNIYVQLAKKQVFGNVGIDMVAGPSEILVIADGTANPVFVAADLLSQAEHDVLATAVLVTNSKQLAYNVQAEVEKALLLMQRQDIARKSIETNGKIILCESIDKAVEISNGIAPEHLEICVDNPFDYLDKITNAGSIFLGKYTPEALGDYYAGPNHTLPTGGNARFSSPLSVDDFVKKSSYIYYTQEGLNNACADVMAFAKSEGLDGHARSVGVRVIKA
ncbi:MAG: histidinol dehydrogenase [Clostridia bacterium]|nr:histidinol dehydrogenase [Clostridia bacterium]